MRSSYSSRSKDRVDLIVVDGSRIEAENALYIYPSMCDLSSLASWQVRDSNLCICKSLASAIFC